MKLGNRSELRHESSRWRECGRTRGWRSTQCRQNSCSNGAPIERELRDGQGGDDTLVDCCHCHTRSEFPRWIDNVRPANRASMIHWHVTMGNLVMFGVIVVVWMLGDGL
jgi:hypothetical protein